MLGTPVRFDYIGAVQTYTVPANCLGLVVDCVGAAGGGGIENSSSLVAGGKGGRVQCKLSVSANQTLNLYVGGKGIDGKKLSGNSSEEHAGGWNGGGKGFSVSISEFGSNIIYGCGSGGGASDIRINGNTLSDRKIVAGAGSGTLANSSYLGAAGGDLVGASGSYGGSGTTAAGGGTQSAGGAGAKVTILSSIQAQSGSLGNGGDGYNQNVQVPGSGGGGGYYGGGGGCSSSGGGGSSYTDSTLCTDVVHTQGYSEATGNGWIILTPILPDAYERDSSNDCYLNIKTTTTTYNSFISAGYKEDGSVNGVYLKDINLL